MLHYSVDNKASRLSAGIIVFASFLLGSFESMPPVGGAYLVNVEGRSFKTSHKTVSLMQCGTYMSPDSAAYASVWFDLPQVLAARGITVTDNAPEGTIALLLEIDLLNNVRGLRLRDYPHSTDDATICNDLTAPLPNWAIGASSVGRETDMTLVAPALLEAVAPHLGETVSERKVIPR